MVSLRPTLSNTGSDYNSLFFSQNGYFLSNFISPKLLIAYSRATSHFNKKSKLWGGGGGGVGLKIVWLIRRGNAYIFIIYHRTINQKDKLLYIDMEKKHSLSLSTKTEI